MHTPAGFEEYFSIENHLLSTRTADAYKVIELSKNLPASLWTLRQPLGKGTPGVKRFLNRMHKIQSLDPKVSEMVSFGVDANGIAFAVFPSFSPVRIIDGVTESHEAERRFVSSVRLIESLHKAEVVCGDIGPSSFVVARDGDVRLVGVLGSFDGEVEGTSMVPPADTLAYLSPEQRTGCAPDKISDVFALGVLCYYLFTRQLPYANVVGPVLPPVESVRPPSTLVPAVPSWIDRLLPMLLEPDASKRIKSASDILDFITVLREESAKNDRSQLVRANRSSGALARQAASSVAKRVEAEPPVQAIARNLGGKKYFLVAGVVAAIVAGAALIPHKDASDDNPILKVHAQVANSIELKAAILELAKKQPAATEISKSLQTVVASDDPIAHDVLVELAKTTDSQAIRKMAEKAVIDRARRLGLVKAAEQARTWLSAISAGEALPQTYDPLLGALNTTLPVDGRSERIRRAYAIDPKLGLRFAAALALDARNPGDYAALLSPLIGDALGISDTRALSPLALIMLHPDLSSVFGDVVIQRKQELRDSDLNPLLEQLVQRNDSHARAIAAIMSDRKILTSTRAEFLNLMRAKSDAPNEVTRALARAAMGTVGLDDVGVFGRWFDISVERVLFLLCADLPPGPVALSAFDVLAGRSLSVEPSASLVEWIRGNYWDERANFVKAVGIMALLDIVSEAQIKEAFETFDKYTKDSRLLDILVDTGNPVVVSLAVGKYGQMISLSRLLSLLSDPAKDVRLSAIDSLKGFNDVGALKIILDTYQQEKDPQVREAYKNSFWVIKQREEAK